MFHFTSKKSSIFGGKYICRPLSIRVFFFFVFYHIFHLIKYFFWKYHPNIIISIFGKKYYSFHYSQQNRPSSQTWQAEQKATWYYYQKKTKDTSWHGGYEFIIRLLIDVVWKSFRHPFFTIPSRGNGQRLSDAIRSIFRIFVGVH